MSVERDDIIDLVGTKEDGQCVLGIVDELAWDEGDERLLILENKINLYLGVIASGDFYEDYPQTRGKKIVIRAFFGLKPNNEGKQFLDRVRKAVSDLGFEFDWQMIEGKGAS